MITPGLVSVTFRQLEPDQIIELARQAGLQGIEWGGDIHVPHGNTSKGEEVRKQTLDSGLCVAAYGSYYKVGHSESVGLHFGSVLETAVALGAPTIRVWAGTLGPDQADTQYRRLVAEDAFRIASLAAEAGVSISFEAHEGSLTDGTEKASTFFTEMNHPNIYAYWQPPHGISVEACRAGLIAVLPRLSNLHVFHWWPTSHDRRPLWEGRDRWLTYLNTAQETKHNHYAMLEFVTGDNLAAFKEDALMLCRWINNLPSEPN